MTRVVYVKPGHRVLFNGKVHGVGAPLVGLSPRDIESLEASDSISHTPIDGRMPTDLVAKAFDEVAHQLAIRTDAMLSNLPGPGPNVDDAAPAAPQVEGMASDAAPTQASEQSGDVQEASGAAPTASVTDSKVDDTPPTQSNTKKGKAGKAKS